MVFAFNSARISLRAVHARMGIAHRHGCVPKVAATLRTGGDKLSLASFVGPPRHAIGGGAQPRKRGSKRALAPVEGDEKWMAMLGAAEVRQRATALLHSL